MSHNVDISAALVIGAQRFQGALLVELNRIDKALDPTERAAVIERIWPTIEEANKEAPSHARLEKSHVLFTQPHKPMLRAGKGTVQRSGTLKAYASEIDALYKDADLMSIDLESEVKEGPQGTLDEATVLKCIRESILSIAEWPSLDESADFFALGMNSLQALMLVRKLRQRLATPVALSTIYTNPSIVTLAAAIFHLLDQTRFSQVSQEQARINSRNDSVQNYKTLVEKRLLPRVNVESKDFLRPEQEVVILTGSTGTLGAYLLDVMLRIPNLAHIYCLNRADDGLSVQTRKNRLLGLQHPPSDKRVSFLTVDFSQEKLNLTEAQYEELESKATLVIHNAWTVNFNLTLSSFQPQLDNLINLLAFANSSANSARVLYISSISSVISYHSTHGKTPEKPVTADTAPGPSGYSESKYVAEQIIEHAAQTVSSGPSLAFARVGQIAGAAKRSGIWSKDEWFPSMIISSVQIGALPDSLGPIFDRIDWVPIDLLAEILMELALERSTSTVNKAVSETRHADVYHPLNPHAITWQDMRFTVLEELGSQTKKQMEVVPLRTWIAKVRKEAESMVDDRGESSADNVNLEAALRKNPAAKLLDFFEGLVSSEGFATNRLEFSQTLKRSKAMRGLEPMKDEWVRKWVREWFAPGADGAGR